MKTRNLTEKQAANLAKVRAKFPHLTFTVFNQNDKNETVTPWGVGVSDSDRDLSKAYAAKPKTERGCKSQHGHTVPGNTELTKAVKAASATLWHRCPPL